MIRRAAVLAAVVGIAGCVGEPKVVRVYDGHIVEGAFVTPEAYSSFLRGVLAEEAGDLRSALAAFEQAAAEDDEDPEPLVRIGALHCRVDPKSRRADDAFARALRIDRTYASALAAQARCAAERGQPDSGVAFVERVAAADRKSADLGALYVKLAAQRANGSADQRARERALALTVANGANPVAWDALVAWGRGKADGELLARGLEGLARVAPMRTRDVEAGVLELLGSGRATLARRVAATLADIPADRVTTTIADGTVARLAVDEAIVHGDVERAERRAARGRVSLSEVAARALILERSEMAADLAGRVVGADPGAGCASMVLAAIASTRASLERMRAEVPTDQPSAACVLVLADRVAALAGPEPARMWVTRVTEGAPRLAFAAHDPVTAPLAVDLAARGVVPESTLPVELRLELAARRREAPPALDERALDAKHLLLWHLLVDPNGTPAKTMLSRLAGSAEHDPIVGFALARAALAAKGASSWEPVLRAIASSPTHPLLLAVAVEIAQRGGRAEEIPPARARLMAVARTPAERALATE